MNIQESQEVTNHCELESFPESARPYEYFCNENKQLGLKYFTRASSNCDVTVKLEKYYMQMMNVVTGM